MEKRSFAQKLRGSLWFLYLPVSVLYLELLMKFWCYRTLTGRGALFTTVFSLAFALVATVLCAIRPGRYFRWSMAAMLAFITILFGVQAVYYRIFKTFLALFSLAGADQVLGSFWREALTGIWKTLPVILPMLLPFVLWLIFKKRLAPPVFPRGSRISLLILFILLQVGGMFLVRSSTSGVMSASYLYYDSYIPEHVVRYFGTITNLELDIKAVLFPEEDVSAEESEEESAAPAPSYRPSPTPATETETPEPEPTATEAVPEAQVWEIDWETLIENETDATLKEMHQYFSSVEPTYTNEYTGYFEGKNLIWIVAEGFSSWAIDETHTPTLYKLANSGFVFENFYNPLWYVSTSDGEFTTLLSLLPQSGVWSMSRSSDNYMPYGFGNLLANRGYTSYAFHNGTATYYDRNLSHPNLGYTFMADGAGLDITDYWPPSDLEMMEETVPLYVDSEPFHAYYMTISGHLYYTFTGNAMAAKHQEEVADLPYSDNARAYIACHMELDQALENLIDQLDEAGVLEDTVIVLSGDHYPYGLEIEEIEELNGGDVEENFELYRSTLIIWNAAMEEPVHVEKTCYSLDILPTLCNLFGLEYDSRLIVGRDIFSDAESLVIFGNHSFITEEGRYNASTDTWEAAEGSGADEAYAAQMLERINRLFEYSANIIDYDYYAVVLGES